MDTLHPINPRLKSGAREEMFGLQGMDRKIRRLQRELVVKVRRRLLEREAGRYPLLKEEMIREELERRPGYYAGEEE